MRAARGRGVRFSLGSGGEALGGAAVFRQPCIDQVDDLLQLRVGQAQLAGDALHQAVDTLDVGGSVTEFVPSACGTAPNPAVEVGQRQLTKIDCISIKTKGGTVVSPRLINGTAVLDSIAQGKNTNDLLRKYGGALVKVEGSFTSIQDPPDSYNAGSAVSKFGDIRVAQTALTVNNSNGGNPITTTATR